MDQRKTGHKSLPNGFTYHCQIRLIHSLLSLLPLQMSRISLYYSTILGVFILAVKYQTLVQGTLEDNSAPLSSDKERTAFFFWQEENVSHLTTKVSVSNHWTLFMLTLVSLPLCQGLTDMLPKKVRDIVQCQTSYEQAVLQ